MFQLLCVSKMILLFMFVTTAVAQKDLSLDCSSDSVMVRWKPWLDAGQKLDPSKALLGNCPPSFVVSDTLMFYVLLNDCGFLKQVIENQSTQFIILSVEDLFKSLSFSYRPKNKVSTFLPVEETEGDVTFNMELMNSDFSAPAASSVFSLGSSIPIRVQVEQDDRMLQVYLESCVAATHSNLSHATRMHTIIANAGCLIESKEGKSTFLPRRKPSELCLYLEAFKFALGENIFLHCDVMAQNMWRENTDRKACHYVKENRRWELLDDLSQSWMACRCCESTCPWRKDNLNGLSVRKVLGPFVMVADQSRRNMTLNTQSSEQGVQDIRRNILDVSALEEISDQWAGSPEDEDSSQDNTIVLPPALIKPVRRHDQVSRHSERYSRPVPKPALALFVLAYLPTCVLCL
ncbi:zona pellucida sperm-binding protein 3-like isoform X2 [Myxocyprinus asiaticus]|uniref:zona pellucida sperm-binding protein 3-like isoform X2 n=1 Tax=Myxocyprinus asiaticus TaxID=70543 RepID=UPI002223A7C7|nr:zona pellucida sperm-binding protein 3-like isoform X2 [Myxocyprinus asiaticus]